MTVPDLAEVEAYHAAVIAAIDRQPRLTTVYGDHKAKDRALADRALARLRRHTDRHSLGTCGCGKSRSECPDALDAWADLTDIGATYLRCHNGHPFRPGTTTDNDSPSLLWCDTCGEARRTDIGATYGVTP